MRLRLWLCRAKKRPGVYRFVVQLEATVTGTEMRQYPRPIDFTKSAFDQFANITHCYVRNIRVGIDGYPLYSEIRRSRRQHIRYYIITSCRGRRKAQDPSFSLHSKYTPNNFRLEYLTLG